jgi:hypothetical protein
MKHSNWDSFHFKETLRERERVRLMQLKLMKKLCGMESKLHVWYEVT